MSVELILTWSATGLPTGLIINTNNGEITGTLTEYSDIGTYTITIRATDQFGRYSEDSGVLEIVDIDASGSFMYRMETPVVPVPNAYEYNQVAEDGDGNVYSAYNSNIYKTNSDLKSYTQVTSNVSLSSDYRPIIITTEDYIAVIDSHGYLFKMQNGETYLTRIDSLLPSNLRPANSTYWRDSQQFTDVKAIPNTNYVYLTMSYHEELISTWVGIDYVVIYVINLETNSIVRESSIVVPRYYSINGIECVDENIAVFVLQKIQNSGTVTVYRTSNQASSVSVTSLTFSSGQIVAMLTVDKIKGWIYFLPAVYNSSPIWCSKDDGLTFTKIISNIGSGFDHQCDYIFEWCGEGLLVTSFINKLAYSDDDGLTWHFARTSYSYTYNVKGGTRLKNGNVLTTSNSGALLLTTPQMLGQIWEENLLSTSYNNTYWNNLIEDTYNNIYATVRFHSYEASSSLVKTADMITTSECSFDFHHPTRYTTEDAKYLRLVKITTDYVIVNNKYSIYKMNHGDSAMIKIFNLESWQDGSGNYMNFQLMVPILNTNKVWVVYQDSSYQKFVALADFENETWIKKDIQLPSSYTNQYIIALDGFATDEDNAMFMFGNGSTNYLKVAITEAGYNVNILSETLNIATDNLSITDYNRPRLTYHKYSGNIYVPPQGNKRFYYTENCGSTWLYKVMDVGYIDGNKNIAVLNDEETYFLIDDLYYRLSFDGVQWQKQYTETYVTAIAMPSIYIQRNDDSLAGFGSDNYSKVSYGSTDAFWIE